MDAWPEFLAVQPAENVVLDARGVTWLAPLARLI
jgi:hypothetical protein